VRRVLSNDGTLWLNLGDSYGKGKQLIGIPWRVAFALQADGWILRQEIIWQKPNPMPESVSDRCTKAHEQVFLLTKSQNYYCDMESVPLDKTQTLCEASMPR
jgi:DNA modification methylase